MDMRAGPGARAAGAGGTGRAGGVVACTSILPMLIRMGAGALSLCRAAAASIGGAAGTINGGLGVAAPPLIVSLCSARERLGDPGSPGEDGSAFDGSCCGSDVCAGERNGGLSISETALIVPLCSERGELGDTGSIGEDGSAFGGFCIANGDGAGTPGAT